MPTLESKLEPEFEQDFLSWKKDPTPQTTGAMLRRLKPAIDRGIHAYVGTSPGPTIPAHAKQLTIKALETYDPARAKLGTHVTNHLQGLRRISRQSGQVLKLPERIHLDRTRLHEVENLLEDRLGRTPSTMELADYSGISPRRIKYVRSFHMPVGSGQLHTQNATNEGGEFQPAVKFDYTEAWQDLVYEDLDPVNQKIMEWTLGMHGEKQLPNHEIARRLRITPGAVSQRKAKIQSILQQESELNPF